VKEDLYEEQFTFKIRSKEVNEEEGGDDSGE